MERKPLHGTPTKNFIFFHKVRNGLYSLVFALVCWENLLLNASKFQLAESFLRDNHLSGWIRKKSENYEHDLKTEIAMIMHGTDSRPALCNLRMKRSAKIGTIL